MTGSSFPKGMKVLFFIPLMFFISISCDQYEYANPTPGIVQINLRSFYNQFDTSFVLNNFTIEVTRVAVFRTDGATAEVYLEPKIIGDRDAAKYRNVYNVLGRKSYDSTEVMGQYPLPPGEYSKVRLTVQPGQTVILDGYRRIRVDRPLNYSSTIDLDGTFVIEESHTTKLVVTLDLDSTLRRLAYTYEYNPKFYLSSVEMN